jgi:F0F1-type ATP synthase membrane subunit c/vacuolar-type H+-ATPase subunit K
VSVPGVALTVVGLAAFGGGVAFGLAAHSAASSVASQYDPNRDAAGKRDATLQWVGYGVGAAALVTGVILLVRGPGESGAASSSEARLDLGVFPGGASLAGRF